MIRVLTFDVEEWFHILDNPLTRHQQQWGSFESRIHHNMQLILDLLDDRGVRATFFCLGWIAEKYPGIVKEIARRGYEIGSHTHLHQLVYEQTPREFREDLHRSITTLQDLTGIKVNTFRAPGFSITEATKWAFEALVEEGIEVDCSIFSGVRAHGGYPSLQCAGPTMLRFNGGGEIKEFPISGSRLWGKLFFFSGGGYFRLLPYCLIKRLTTKTNYVMSYLHPRDFDPGQPVLAGLPAVRRFKCYVGLGYTERKLKRWLGDFQFTDLAGACSKVHWNKMPAVQL